jgi:5-methyltetrahydrofolate--homocysteine methyltransferase
MVNPVEIRPPDDLDGELREAAENLILNRKTTNPVETFLALALKTQEGGGAQPEEPALSWRSLSPEERIIHALIRGIDGHIEEDLGELRGRFPRAMDILEGPLLEGMREVGRRFGEGTMFLPQVIRSARVMKKAAAVLEPLMEAEKKGKAGAAKVVLATVKGDVHDIGKNIVAVVLGCNGYEVVNLGVMVPAEKILDAARREGASFIGLSGLISPSLDEMVRVAEEMEKQGFKIPLLIGGAAASAAHTGLRIAPAYSGPVVYVPDAGQSPLALGALLSPNGRFRFLEKLEEDYEAARRLHAQTREKRELLPLEEARANRVTIDWGGESSGPAPAPRAEGLVKFDEYPVEKLFPYIDWTAFCNAFDLGRKEGAGPEEERRRLREDAGALLQRIAEEKLLTLRGRAAVYPALSEGEDIVLFAPAPGEAEAAGEEIARFRFLRNQTKKIAGGRNPCLSDFILPRGSLPREGRAAGEGPGIDWLGLFAVSAGFGLEEAAAPYKRAGDDYSALLLAALADRLAEAFAEELHQRVRRELWAYAPDEAPDAQEPLRKRYRGIRPAFGYPPCPDHRDKEIALKLLDPGGSLGIRLSETGMMIPASSACGMYFAHPAAYYFAVGEAGEDQLAAWAVRKGIDLHEARRRTGVL